jgi:hypothetical protein
MAAEQIDGVWRGTEPEDIKAYLEAITVKGYPSTIFRLSTCHCGCQSFGLVFDKRCAGAIRTCQNCQESFELCDTQEYWENAKPRNYGCERCGNAFCNVGAGFAMRTTGDVKWVFIGVRCVVCGTFDCVTDWKVGYGPTDHFFDLV